MNRDKLHTMGLIHCCTSPAFENTPWFNEMINSNSLSPILHKLEEKKLLKPFKPLHYLWVPLVLTELLTLSSSHLCQRAEYDPVYITASLSWRWSR